MSQLVPHMLIAFVALVVVAAFMLFEQRISVSNERWLRAHGAVEPPRDVFAAMQWVYPLSFVVMAIEGALAAHAPGAWTIAGALVFALAKALKFWAITSLGTRWTFKVLVLPGAPLVTRGPYAYVRHPNYIGVMGELVGMALLLGARVTGPLTTMLFAMLIRARIKVEEAALRHPPCT
jgi:methyltransferase